jgi:murein L,D-transpeptidase YcbB/YkuD
VNAAAFALDVFEDDSLAAEPRLSMRVIVGQANGRHNTPTFTATMREVVFRPYWDVPPRIARLELIPTFRRRPDSYDRDGFEIVRQGVGDVDAMVYPPTPESFARVVRGELRLRQRPGPENALGLVKFLFPNPYNVYLHDTPTKDLFARSRRDFSHGCIRVARPADLAELVLRGHPPWTREAIDSVMAGSTTLHVTVDRPLAVFIAYMTASAWANGDVQFVTDLYGSDVRLERALGLSPISSAP